MDNLHTVLRSIREDKSRRPHLDIFREFLSHLDRIGRRTGQRPPSTRAHGKPRSPRKTK
jgi:hypothetical protein